jgi:hypothetical protein
MNVIEMSGFKDHHLDTLRGVTTQKAAIDIMKHRLQRRRTNCMNINGQLGGMLKNDEEVCLFQ